MRVDELMRRVLEWLRVLQPSDRHESEALALTRAQTDELDRRLDQIERGEARTILWEEVRRELERDE